MSVHMFCVALILVGCQHVHHTATLIVVRAHACWEILQHLMGLAQAISVHRKVVSSAQQSLHHLAMSPYTRDYGKASSWYSKGWALSKKKKKPTLESKRATRGHHGHEWDVDASRGSTQTWWVQPETWADAEVEVVDERDKNQGRAATNDAVSSKTAIATGNSAGDAATEKEAMRRLEVSTDCKTVAMGASTLTTWKTQTQMTRPVTSIRNSYRHRTPWRRVATRANEHEARNVLHATTLEVAEKLEL